MRSSLIHTTNLSIGYTHKKAVRLVQKELSLSVGEGEMICLIGPNGCGKSTLLRTLAGLQKPLAGDLFLGDLSLSTLSPSERSKHLAVVLTDKVDIANFTVGNIVALGRHPYTNWLGQLTAEDHFLMDQSLDQVHLSAYKDRLLGELSDGELQRAMIARALVQDTPIILLDEPTAHLDLPNRVEVMMLLRELAKQTHKSILLSTHELDLALQTSDLIWLMSAQKGVVVGAPEDLIIQGELQQVFANPSYTFSDATGAFCLKHQTTLFSVSVVASGTGNCTIWTRRALERNGFSIVDNAACSIFVDEEKKTWKVSFQGKTIIQSSISQLLQTLYQQATSSK
ncbi:MAG: ABC transporter ATP-binding protein [Bacteroidaceae bacterium]